MADEKHLIPTEARWWSCDDLGLFCSQRTWTPTDTEWSMNSSVYSRGGSNRTELKETFLKKPPLKKFY